jgi:hypothetical protein
MPVIIPPPVIIPILAGRHYGGGPVSGWEIFTITAGTLVFGVGFMWAIATCIKWFDSDDPKTLFDVLRQQWVWLSTLLTTGKVPKRKPYSWEKR